MDVANPRSPVQIEAIGFSRSKARNCFYLNGTLETTPKHCFLSFADQLWYNSLGQRYFCATRCKKTCGFNSFWTFDSMFQSNRSNRIWDCLYLNDPLENMQKKHMFFRVLLIKYDTIPWEIDKNCSLLHKNLAFSTRFELLTQCSNQIEAIGYGIASIWTIPWKICKKNMFIWVYW